MQIQSKRNRTIWVFAVLGLIPDAVIAAILARVLEGGFLGFLAVLVGLQVLYLLIWAKNSVWTWIVFFIFRKQTTSEMCDHFRANRFPEPDDHYSSPEQYFDAVAENKTLPVDVRIKAARELGALHYLTGAGRFQESVRAAMTCEDGLLQFKRSFPSHSG